MIRLGLLAVGALLVAGCFRVEIDAVVEEDGSGRFTILQAIDPSAAESLAEQFGDGFGEDGGFGEGDGFGEDDGLGEGSTTGDTSVEELIEIDRSRLPSYVGVEEVDDGDFVGLRLTVPFDDPDQANARLAETFAALSEDPADAEEIAITIRRDGDRWHFDGSVGAPTADEGLDEMPPGLAELFLGDASFEVGVRLPGRVVEHDATRVDGDRLVWEVELTATQPMSMSATSEPDGGASIPAAALFAVPATLAVGLAGVVVSLLWFRRRDSRGEGVAGGPPVVAAWDAAPGASPPVAPTARPGPHPGAGHTPPGGPLPPPGS
ncbi:MAG: hypothetical protein S0880_04110 [Actinomycetota bacterium]|nr:hypothetical protein [Actinomycetota bacterium]